MVMTIGKQIVQLDMLPDVVGKTSSVLFFKCHKDICEIVTSTNQLSISILQL